MPQDTTESLGILDSKFSGQNTDMDSKISSLQASVDKVPTKTEFEKTIEDALGKAKKAQDKLDEVGKEITDIRADQTNDDGRILTLNGKADEQTNDNDKNWKDVLDMIHEEGDLFSKISKKLKDEDLRKVNNSLAGLRVVTRVPSVAATCTCFLPESHDMRGHVVACPLPCPPPSLLFAFCSLPSAIAVPGCTVVCPARRHLAGSDAKGVVCAGRGHGLRSHLSATGSLSGFIILGAFMHAT